MSASPIPRRHSEMPVRGTPPRKISTFTDNGRGETRSPDQGEMRRGSSNNTANISFEQRKARREQFRNFYGLKEGQHSSSNSSSNENTKADQLDIDSLSFNASAYYEDLISKQSLKGLMEKAYSLNSDIGNLEGSRHSLVYNHHHQLFEAGDTISKLNSRTPQLISIVNQLQESFSNIEQLIDSISVITDKQSNGKAQNEDLSIDNKRLEILRNGKERIELMITAKESPKEIRSYYESLKEKIQTDETDDQGNKEEIDNQLKELEKIVEELPQEKEGA
ncbi:uncharacterized protein L201_007406 [Kwoniella dendrophila CBS 6074]|uniref:Vacuolar protein sorting-associated protein 51 homolog n=1 Tax=Kwoniella dendrophila CBS 6074 TaxID=1295534 RepID=A0AAX4K5T6_9TREE